MKNLDWPEAIWEAWIAFEHLRGSVEDLDACLDKIEKAQYQVNSRRAKVISKYIFISCQLLNHLQEAEKATFAAMQIAMETQAATVQVADAPVPDVNVPMEVDVPHERGTKRGAEDEPAEGHKKAKIGEP